MFDYGALPPEITSALMYAGSGSAPMMANAAAWRTLTAELTEAWTSYEAVISQLASEEWMGPASASMAAAAKPYVAWMRTAASQAEHTATQATAAAAAYEAAHAGIIPPPVIATNRAQHAALVATNFLGQNTAAIMANEAQYGGFWANNTGTMYHYAGTSATAAQLTPFSEPMQATNPAGMGNQAAAVGQAGGTAAGNTAQTAQLISSLPNAIQGLSSPIASASSAPGALTGLGLNLGDMANVALNGVSSGAATAVCYIPSTLIPSMIGYLTGPGFNALGGGASGAGIGALLAPGGPLGALGGLGGGVSGAAGAASAAAGTMGATTPAISATMGHASLVSHMSVPTSWSAATPASTGTAAVHGAGWAVAPENNSVAAMPGGMPIGGGGRGGGFGFGAPRYGFKPTVIPRPVAG